MLKSEHLEILVGQVIGDKSKIEIRLSDINDKAYPKTSNLS